MKLIRNTETGEVFHANDAHSKDLVANDTFEFIGLDEAPDQEAQAAGQTDQPEDLSALKKDELVALAEKKGVEFDSKATKDDLIEAIQAAGQTDQ
jgi:hypothetical protein